VQKVACSVIAILVVVLPTPGLAKDAKRSSVLTLEAVNSAELRNAKEVGKAQLLKAQILLDRARFSPGVIDGTGGTNLTKAIAAFERQNGFREDGKLDAETWAKLRDTSQDPALVEYTITEADLKGPFTPKLPRKLEEQADLDWLGYANSIELLAEKFT
jgi:peptidoglycan hydrolase-like protein with peptidoglycan-binding domain